MRIRISRSVFSPDFVEQVREAVPYLPVPDLEGSYEESLKAEWAPVFQAYLVGRLSSIPLRPKSVKFAAILQEMVETGLGHVGVALDHWEDSDLPFAASHDSPYRFLQWYLAPGPLAGMDGPRCPEAVQELAMLWPMLDAELDRLLDARTQPSTIDHHAAIIGLGQALAVSGAFGLLFDRVMPVDRIAAVLNRLGHQSMAIGRATREDARPDGAGPSRGILLGTVADFVLAFEVVRASRIHRGEPKILLPPLGDSLSFYG